MLKTLLFVSLCQITAFAQLQFSGVYPHLVLSNREGECGPGAVVPWADRLWVITYGPHLPKGSSDKLYEITPDLQKIVRPESIGGTPANRMIHEESQQLFIGPYVIDAKGTVRTIPYTKMFGRHTGNARHLTDPAGKILYATMEEGIYEVDVKTLEVTDLWIDEQLVKNGPLKKGVQESKSGRAANLPGYHGKGFYSAQGRYVYANNGDHAPAARSNPRVPSGVLAEWDGKADAWTVVRRNQFTEVTGPGGITGKAASADAPLWAVGWDHRSVILMCLHQGKWHSYRLPKGSHSYDGAHGWNTEWPRIRDIGEKDLLMTMHGTFWHFPKNFHPQQSAGIQPRSNYLKVVGDFCEWQGKIVLGCDDTAKSEFLNKRSAKGEIAPPRSQSNLWFIDHEKLDQLGAPIGRGSVWLDDDVKKNDASEAYLFNGYDQRILHLTHQQQEAVPVRLEVDRKGNGQWTTLATIEAAAGKLTSHVFSPNERAAWIRVVALADAKTFTASFSYRSAPRHTTVDKALFAGIAAPTSSSVTGGLIRALDDDALGLGMVATDAQGQPTGYYTMNSDMKLVRSEDAAAFAYGKQHTKIAEKAYQLDAASALIIDDKGQRWRFPVSPNTTAKGSSFGSTRVVREVATERDMLNLCGTFYELPAENAGGYAMARPVATHDRMIHDYCSWHGLLLFTGVETKPNDNSHIIRSADGKAALWAGVIDDVWKLGKPRGLGGPWKDQAVKSGTASDPYLMTGFDQKSLEIKSDQDTTILIEVDLSGYGNWVTYQSVPVKAGKAFAHRFDDAFSAYWIRFTSSADATVSAQLTYQ
ncbi:MAG: hypothetical protein RLZZ224_1435 [Verrucomicrobiota bacterium]